MKRAVSLSLISLIIALIFFLFKPSDEFVKDEAYKHIRSEINVTVPEDGVISKGFELLMKQKITVKDRFLFKEAFYESGGNLHIAGYGFLNIFKGTDLKNNG